MENPAAAVANLARMTAMSPFSTNVRRRCRTAAQWLRRSYFPEPPEAGTWTPPEGTWPRIRPTIDGLVILLLVTVTVSLAGWVFMVGTLCEFRCQQNQFTAGGMIATFMPLVSSAMVAVVTVLRAADGRRPVRCWILGLALIGVWFFLGLQVMGSAMT